MFKWIYSIKCHQKVFKCTRHFQVVKMFLEIRKTCWKILNACKFQSYFVDVASKLFLLWFRFTDNFLKTFSYLQFFMCSILTTSHSFLEQDCLQPISLKTSPNVVLFPQQYVYCSRLVLFQLRQRFCSCAHSSKKI